MSLQFSRSMRSMKSDSYRASRIGLILAILLMLFLVAWFFFSRVTLYESSSDLRGEQDGFVTATFKEEALSRIRPGQAALLRLSGGTNQRPVPLEAAVFSVDRESGQVELLVLAGDLPGDLLSGKLAGQVEIEVERVTPIELVLRTSGKYLSNSDVQLSPQNSAGTE